MFDILKKKISGFVNRITKGAVKETDTAKKSKEVVDGKKEKKKVKKVAKIGIREKIVSAITGNIEVKEQHIKDALENLEMDLIEADVSLDVAEGIKSDVRKGLVGKKIERSKVNEVIYSTIRKSISSRIYEPEFDIVYIVKETIKEGKKPFVIVFFGPNGSGKTTTMAKVAYMLLHSNLHVIFASADTFRPAAIEQLEEHAKRLGIENIKRQYGSDPAAVAYDAIQHAKSKGIDVVLVDTAGRQDTNYNLLQELKKIVRVANPDLKIYIGESISGHAAIDQISEFNEEIGLDGVILTKVDLDPKGGIVVSIYDQTRVPILYVGVGQKYDDLVPFKKDWVLRNLGMG